MTEINIAEAQVLLEHAIAAHAAASDETRTRKAKAVIHLAKRLLSRRRQVLKASVQAEETMRGASSKTLDELQRLEDGGIPAILAEYGGLAALTRTPRT
jgi:hypothetical protein